MAREIKFRVWDNQENNFWGEGRNLSHVSMVADSLVNDDTTILEQYTGIKDFNGVEIYQNDIVQPIQSYQGVPNMKPSKRGLPMVVKSGDYVYGKWIAREVKTSGFGVYDYHFSEELQVIGNIHENPELLED